MKGESVWLGEGKKKKKACRDQIVNGKMGKKVWRDKRELKRTESVGSYCLTRNSNVCSLIILSQ